MPDKCSLLAMHGSWRAALLCGKIEGVVDAAKHGSETIPRMCLRTYSPKGLLYSAVPWPPSRPPPFNALALLPIASMSPSPRWHGNRMLGTFHPLSFCLCPNRVLLSDCPRSPGGSERNGLPSQCWGRTKPACPSSNRA